MKAVKINASSPCACAGVEARTSKKGEQSRRRIIARSNSGRIADITRRRIRADVFSFGGSKDTPYPIIRADATTKPEHPRNEYGAPAVSAAVWTGDVVEAGQERDNKTNEESEQSAAECQERVERLTTVILFFAHRLSSQCSVGLTTTMRDWRAWVT